MNWTVIFDNIGTWLHLTITSLNIPFIYSCFFFMADHLLFISSWLFYYSKFISIVKFMANKNSGNRWVSPLDIFPATSALPTNQNPIIYSSWESSNCLIRFKFTSTQHFDTFSANVSQLLTDFDRFQSIIDSFFIFYCMK